MREFLRLWGSCIHLWFKCVRTSQLAHAIYKRVRLPVHGCYFGLEVLSGHGVLAMFAGVLLLLVVVGILVGEDAL